jgi:hypothetical protein
MLLKTLRLLCVAHASVTMFSLYQHSCEQTDDEYRGDEDHEAFFGVPWLEMIHRGPTFAPLMPDHRGADSSA